MTLKPSMLRTPFAIAVIQFVVSTAGTAEPLRIPLWDRGAPGTPTTKPEDEPVLLLSRPAADAATRTAVIVCPGGGYVNLAMDHEGRQIADWFNSLGVTAFVLQYRNSKTGHQHPVPMMDGQRAIRTVRARATEWNIDPAKIGVMGFSAGGHLASTLATHFDRGQTDAADPIDRVSSRPDFLILCYPVITMTAPYMHRGSRDNLLGRESNDELARKLSNDLQVTAETPPTFIFQTDADRPVPAENCVAFYLALRKAGVPAEMHIYQDGQHGVGLARNVAGTSTWPDRLRDWMLVRELLTPSAANQPR
jgi:acetyl esterase/lipase